MVETKNYRLLNKGVRLLQAIAVVAMVSLPLMAVAQEAQPAASGEVAIPPAGDYATGKALFTGEKRFTNGGPPCISCHSAGVGALGGGILGPNLTKAFADPSKNTLLRTAWVNGGGRPVMGPIFSSKNITDEEMTDLRAFFEAASTHEVAPASTGKFTIIGF